MSVLFVEGSAMNTNRKQIHNSTNSSAIFPAFLNSIVIIFMIFSTGCTGMLQETSVPNDTTPLESPIEPNQSNGEEIPIPFDIQVDLSAGNAQQVTPEPVKLVAGEPLTFQEANEIFDRLPALPVSTEEQTEFNYPVELLPPPRPGTVIEEEFPQPEIVPTPELGVEQPLQVVRFAPEGEIPIAPFISITFSQAMVPLGTFSDLSQQDVPVRVTPELPGTWRWLGTKTLTFEYDSDLIDRLPKATEYTVTIPKGTRSVNGNLLAEAITWSFSTPAPSIETMYPRDIPQSLDPLIFLHFDQRIDPSEVLKTIKVYAGAGEVALRLATENEISSDDEIQGFVENAAAGRWMVFRATQPLLPDATVSVTVGPGTPSAEGPLVTTTPLTFNFYTYAPLRVTDHGCYWYSNNCVPLAPFSISFNNPLDEGAFTEAWVTVEPEIPGILVNAYGNMITISGETEGQTIYTVTISRNLRDEFGQRLGKDEKLTFKVGKAEPRLIGPQKFVVTLDPAAKKPVFNFYAVNYDKVKVQVYSVKPEDWEVFSEYFDKWQQTDKMIQIPGKLVLDELMNLDIPDDVLSEVGIDLSTYLKNGFGQFIIKIEPPEGMFVGENEKWERYYQTIHAWVQVTNLAVDAYVDHSEMVVWVNDLRDGSPLSGISVRPTTSGRTYTTGLDGLVKFPIPSSAYAIVASQGSDTSMLLYSPYPWDTSGWPTHQPTDSLRWFVFDDRSMYRPGEEVHIKGWLRRLGGRQDGDVSLLGNAVTRVGYQLTDAQGNNILSGDAEVSALGGFDFSFTIPELINLGTSNLQLWASGNLGGIAENYYYHFLQIQEFRTPEFEVNARNVTSPPYFAGGEAVVAVEAAYYAGGALPNAEVTWQVKTSPGRYSPPNWPDFIFGEWHPWWWDEYRYASYWPEDEGITETFAGVTDNNGEHYLKLEFDQVGDPGEKPEPKSVVAQATVMDVNRQAWASTTSLLVHPADLYIGLRSERYFVNKGTPIKVEFIVTDLDGNSITDRPVTITAARLEWKYRNDEWTEEETDVQTCQKRSGLDPEECSFETSIGGSYRVSGTVTDDAGRVNQTRFMRWVSGGQRPAARDVEQEEVTLVPDKESYQPGDTAEILVQSPFSPAYGLLTVSRSGFLYTESFEVHDGSIILRIPIEAQYIPNLRIQVDLVGAADRLDDQGRVLKKIDPRPAFATAQLNLSIPPLLRTLSLSVDPDLDQLEPGGETTLRVKLTDADGNPVPDAELAVVVVDEAILALTNYQMKNPISVFYTDREAWVTSYYGRSSVVLANPEALLNQARQGISGMGGGMDTMATTMSVMEAPMPSAAESKSMSDEADSVITVRTDFNPLAVFEPEVRTGADGEARVAINLPDNLTRYRIMVVGVDSSGQRFGTGESNLTARLPLMVRPSAPRFLNFGDQFELPVILQNQTDEPLEVAVVARATNLELAVPGIRVTIPANDRVEVRFPASTIMAGSVRVQVAAISGNYADAAVVEIPVYTPATTEAFATYGVIDSGAIAQLILHPSDVFSQFGGLEISTSSTALQALTDAVLYLVEYPFEYSEQLASRIMGIASLRDVLTAFKSADLPAPEVLEDRVASDIETLQGLQNTDGGFPYWRRGFESIPFHTIHVTHALARAAQKGYTVPDEMLSRTMAYLRDIESHYPWWYTEDTRRTLSAYALYVRNLWGDRDAGKALRLINDIGLDNLSMEAIGWLWSVIDNEYQLEEIRRFVNNHVVETAGAANFTTAYSDQTYLLLSSDRRTDAILLDALMEDNPDSDLIPKLVNGLLAHRKKGRWDNTQENVFVLIALDRYFKTYEAQDPNFVARMWLGDTYAGSSEFSGYNTDTHEISIPMKFVLDNTTGADGINNITISKEGEGRLYYRLGLKYAPTDLVLDPMDMGFVVERSYEAVDDPEDVSRDAEGVWHIKAGARVKVVIKMVADNRRYHVALVDPLPAGLEIINPALAVSQNPPQEDPEGRLYGWWWWGTWYEHQNLRDDRAEAFTSLLWDGVYEYTYYARATTPGTFVVPPTKAEEMYSPEVFGRSSSDQVVIE
jgi:hypothetical protein